MRIAFVSCVKKKKDIRSKAKDLYISDLFKKSITYAINNYDKVYVLSAKHGVLALETEIEPYETTLNNMKRKEIAIWGKGVAEEIKSIVSPEDELFFLAGKKYYLDIVTELSNKINIPMEGLPIGKRLQWLKQ